MHPCLSLNVQSNPDYRGMTACDKSAFHPIPIAPNGARRGYVAVHPISIAPNGARRGYVAVHPISIAPNGARRGCIRALRVRTIGRRGDATVFGPTTVRGPPRESQALCRYVMRPRVRS